MFSLWYKDYLKKYDGTSKDRKEARPVEKIVDPELPVE